MVNGFCRECYRLLLRYDKLIKPLSFSSLVHFWDNVFTGQRYYFLSFQNQIRGKLSHCVVILLVKLKLCKSIQLTTVTQEEMTKVVD